LTGTLTIYTHSLLVAAEKHSSNFIAPLPIGLALFVAELASGALEISLFLEIPEY
jgi:hypothetical protein